MHLSLEKKAPSSARRGPPAAAIGQRWIARAHALPALPSAVTWIPARAARYAGAYDGAALQSRATGAFVCLGGAQALARRA